MAIGVWSVAGRRIDIIFLLIVLAALLLRLQLATTLPYIHDEENTSIPLSRLISFAPGSVYLPIRAVNHPALPAYFVKASSALFGTTPLAYRSVHVLAGLCTIAIVFLLTNQWYGPAAARWAAALLAFNEYFLVISARVTAHAPYLLFAAAALYFFSRFLGAQRAVYVYAAGVSVGLAFYCKEHAVFLLPVFFLTLLHPTYRHWFRSPHVYLACAVFFLLIAPDIYWNVTADPSIARVTYGNRDVAQATYWSYFQRIGLIAFSLYPVMFYARSTVSSVYLFITGGELDDNTPEYHSMNPAIGLVLLGAVLVTTFRAVPRDHIRRFLLILFWGVFGFFTVIRKGDSPGLDPISWVWVDVTMIPAVVIAGASLARATGRSRILTWAFSGGALVYACAWLVA